MSNEQSPIQKLEADLLKAVAAGKTKVEDALARLSDIRSQNIGHVVREALQRTSNATEVLADVQNALLNHRVALGPDGARMFENFEGMLVHGAEMAGSQVSHFFNHTKPLSPNVGAGALGSRELRPAEAGLYHHQQLKRE